MKVALKKLVEIKSGYSPSTFELMEIGTIPYVKVEDLNNCTKYQCESREYCEDADRSVSAGSIIFPKRGGAIMNNKVRITATDICMDTNMMAIIPNGKIQSEFLYYTITHEKLSRIADTSTIPQINNKHINPYKVALPPLPEQKAIADMLSTWDEAIEKTERLIQAKEASLKDHIQRMMGKEAIEANGWSMVHLGSLFSEVTRKVGEKKLTPYSISAGIGFVSQREKWGKDISGSQHKNYTHLKAGEFSYNKGNSKRYQQGCVYLLKEGEICVPNVFISFKPKAKNVVPEFFEHYFIADYHARELRRYITSGARSDGLLNLNKKDYFKIMVPCPSPDEQKAIAEALTASQHEIDLLKQLGEKYKTQKRGLMQKMLTSEWRVKPEIVNQYMEV